MSSPTVTYAEQFNDMDRNDRVLARKTCRAIMRDPEAYEDGLVGMCKALH